MRAAPFGMALFLVSLGVLFLAGLVAWAVVASRADEWPPSDAPPLPGLLWVSTALLAAGSATVQRAVGRVGADRTREARHALAATLVLGISFLVCQGTAWSRLAAADLTMRSSLAGWLFYFLTGLHAAHVVGGLVPVALVTRRAFGEGLGPRGADSVRHCAAYWHFLGVVWLVLFAVLGLTLGTGSAPRG